MKDLEDIWRCTRERGSFANHVVFIVLPFLLILQAFVKTGIRFGC
ncbi:unnamed protein product [Musa textilis]